MRKTHQMIAFYLIVSIILMGIAVPLLWGINITWGEGIGIFTFIWSLNAFVAMIKEVKKVTKEKEAIQGLIKANKEVIDELKIKKYADLNPDEKAKVDLMADQFRDEMSLYNESKQ